MTALNHSYNSELKNLTSNSQLHKPVLIDKMLEHLAPRDGGHYLDCTFGAGGYAQAILKKANCFVTALDRDPNVIHHAKNLFNNYGNRFELINIDFARASEVLPLNKTFDGIVADLGVSSMQIDEPKRGFSFSKDGPLDMRMNDKDDANSYSAYEFINEATEVEIADVIYRYGDETFSRIIAKNIVAERAKLSIKSTLQLASVIHGSIGKRGKIDSATKTFQAIRIHINQELEQLETLLANVYKLLAISGRICLISFHSLEDRIIKDFFKNNSAKAKAISKYATKKPIEDIYWLETITKKPITPSIEELNLNIRSRSAKLRAAIRVK